MSVKMTSKNLQVLMQEWKTISLQMVGMRNIGHIIKIISSQILFFYQKSALISGISTTLLKLCKRWIRVQTQLLLEDVLNITMKTVWCLKILIWEMKNLLNLMNLNLHLKTSVEDLSHTKVIWILQKVEGLQIQMVLVEMLVTELA